MVGRQNLGGLPLVVKKSVENPHPKIVKNLESKSLLTVNVATIFLLLKFIESLFI